MSRWSLFFLIMPVAGAALFAAAEYLGWSLPPVASTLGAKVDHLYYLALAIIGVVFLFTHLALAFVVFFYSQPPQAPQASRKSDSLSTIVWLLLPLVGFIALVMVFPMSNQARLFVGTALCLGWPMVFILLAAGRVARANPVAVYSHGNTGLEIGWTVVPTFVFIALFTYQLPVWEEYRYSRSKPTDAKPIRVIAQQFEWRFIHPGPDGKLDTPDDIHVPQELHIVKSAPVLLELRSMDVIHSFYLPYHRMKQDIVPGLSIPLWFDSVRSTWESQADRVSFVPDDVVEPETWDRHLEAASSAAWQFVKSKLPAEIRATDASSRGRWIEALNGLLEDSTLWSEERFPLSSLSLDVRQLLASKPEGAMARLLNRKLLDELFQGTTKPVKGDFDIVCAELCGPRHYRMKGRLVVHETQAQLDEWSASLAENKEVSP